MTQRDMAKRKKSLLLMSRTILIFMIVSFFALGYKELLITSGIGQRLHEEPVFEEDIGDDPAETS